jgi:hypothetical protein
MKFGNKLTILLETVRGHPNLSSVVGLYWLRFDVIGIYMNMFSLVVGMKVESVVRAMRGIGFTVVEIGAHDYTDNVPPHQVAKIKQYTCHGVNHDLDSTARRILSSPRPEVVVEPILDIGLPAVAVPIPRVKCIDITQRGEEFAAHCIMSMLDNRGVDPNFKPFQNLLQFMRNGQVTSKEPILYKLAALCVFTGYYPNYGLKTGIMWILTGDPIGDYILIVFTFVAVFIGCTVDELREAVLRRKLGRLSLDQIRDLGLLDEPPVVPRRVDSPMVDLPVGYDDWSMYYDQAVYEDGEDSSRTT